MKSYYHLIKIEDYYSAVYEILNFEDKEKGINKGDLVVAGIKDIANLRIEAKLSGDKQDINNLCNLETWSSDAIIYRNKHEIVIF